MLVACSLQQQPSKKQLPPMQQQPSSEQQSSSVNENANTINKTHAKQAQSYDQNLVVSKIFIQNAKSVNSILSNRYFL